METQSQMLFMKQTNKCDKIAPNAFNVHEIHPKVIEEKYKF